MLAQTIDNITRGWELQGWEKGEAEGLKKGQAEGQRNLLLKLHATKFGAVPEAVRDRVASASTEQLEAWAERLLSAESPGDVFND